MDSEKVLIVVDMQNDFVSGSLKIAGAADIVPKICGYIKNNYCDKYDEIKYNHAVIFTRDTHTKNYLKTHEGILLPIIHCVEDTPGWCIVDELFHYANKPCLINKTTFGYNDWLRFFFNDCGMPTEIEICGVATDICVISNALILRSVFPNIKISVLEDLCAGTTEEKHKEAISIMESCQVEVARSI